MEGTAARGRVTRRPPDRATSDAGRLVVETARPGDDVGIRELLRGRAMGGMIRLTLEREPCVWHAAAVEGERHHTVVARERASGRILGMGSRAVRDVWIDGERARMGYLTQLRLAPEIAAGRRLLAAGFQSCNRHRRQDELPFDLTSIVADNVPARRLLERGLPGFPRYRRLCRLVTLTIPTLRRSPLWGRKRATRAPSPLAPLPEGEGNRGWLALAVRKRATLPAIVRCLHRNLRRYQLAPAWTEDDLRSSTRTRGLEATDFLVRTDGDDRVTACLAIWDQRGFKQVVVRDYAPALRRFRPLVNLLLAIAGRPRLPPPGSTLELAYLSHLAVDGDRADVAVKLIRAARREAGRCGLDYLVLSLTEAHPMLGAVRRAFPARELESVLYLVHPEEGTPPELDDRCPHVEAATL